MYACWLRQMSIPLWSNIQKRITKPASCWVTVRRGLPTLMMTNKYFAVKHSYLLRQISATKNLRSQVAIYQLLPYKTPTCFSPHANALTFSTHSRTLQTNPEWTWQWKCQLALLILLPPKLPWTNLAQKMDIPFHIIVHARPPYPLRLPSIHFVAAVVAG